MRRGLPRPGLLVVVALWAAFAPRARADGEPTLETVLARAGTYVLRLQEQLSGIVAEEFYVQDVKALSSLGTGMNSLQIPHRELKSDLLLVRPIGSDHWVQFRDVFDVDGAPVRDRSERLMKLFLTPSTSTATQAQLIADESARYNIGNLQRTVNVPVLALVILDPLHQSRFKFTRSRKNEKLNVRSAASDAESVWTVDYREVEPQTIIRTANYRDMPSRGRFWIEAETGRVIASELIAEDVTVTGVVEVGYDVEPTLKTMVPIEMRERYDVRRGLTRVSGVATYSKFRQFQVKVDEKIAPIK